MKRKNNKKVILIVKDDAMNLKLIRDLLMLSNFKVLETDSGTHCLDIANEKKPNLILMDVGLPDIDGFEVTKILKAEVYRFICFQR